MSRHVESLLGHRKYPTKFLREAFVRLCHQDPVFLLVGSLMDRAEVVKGSDSQVYRRIFKLKCDDDIPSESPILPEDSLLMLSALRTTLEYINFSLVLSPTHCRSLGMLKLIQTSQCSIHFPGKLWPAAVTSL